MNKIPVDFICFPFSESGDKKLNSLFYSWQDAEDALASVNPPDLGYYKTDFVITWQDGEVYEGRFDIGADAPTLKEHILCFWGRMAEQNHSDKEMTKEIKEFFGKYQIGA